jgi:bacterioferritin-associated ferredoxin
MIVCVCRGVSERQVEAVVAAGATTADQVSRACGAGSDCGACRFMVTEIAENARGAACPAGARA